MNQTRYFLPHIYALSVNSPFWVGRNTGLTGYRLKCSSVSANRHSDAFERFRIQDYCKLLVKTGCIDNPKKIWWDIRLHPSSTLEMRIGDAQSRVTTPCHGRTRSGRHCQALQIASANTTFRVYRRRLLEENRWRAFALRH